LQEIKIAMSTTKTEDDRPGGTQSVAGVWNREWLESPLGTSAAARDVSTFVWWMQSSAGVYIDLRLAVGIPGRQPADSRPIEGLVLNPLALQAVRASDTLYDLVVKNPSILDGLMDGSTASFAGVLNVADGDTTTSGRALQRDSDLANGEGELCTCLWHRHVDFQPPSGELDLGVCRIEPASPDDGSVFMRETGEDASYAEGWRKYGGAIDPKMTLTLHSENGHTDLRTGYWLRLGERFAYVVGRPQSPGAAATLGCHEGSIHVASTVGSKNLAQCLEGLSSLRDKLDVAMSYVAVMGHIDDAGQCLVHYSTNPELVGVVLPEGIVSDDGTMVTQSIGNVTRVWMVVE
jgi:hypothetical protein